jgi:hypothetical protein
MILHFNEESDIYNFSVVIMQTFSLVSLSMQKQKENFKVCRSPGETPGSQLAYRKFFACPKVASVVALPDCSVHLRRSCHSSPEHCPLIASTNLTGKLTSSLM